MLRRTFIPVPVLRYFETEGKEVAFTFDDGPSVPYTAQILDILKNEKIHATFFVLGTNAEKYPELLRRIKNEGHAIGNHTYTHPRIPVLSPPTVHNELAKTSQIVYAITGAHPTLFRPPYLHSSFFAELTVWLSGYQTVLCTIDAIDWKKKSPRVEHTALLRRAAPGSIFLFHDGEEKNPSKKYDRADTVRALPSLIRSLKRRGYRFITLPKTF